MAPEQADLFLFAPPFKTWQETVQKDIASGSTFLSTVAGPEVEPDSLLLIGDFGLGSDSPIALRYDMPSRVPEVWRLVLTTKGDEAPYELIGTWHPMAATFDEFVALLGL